MTQVLMPSLQTQFLLIEKKTSQIRKAIIFSTYFDIFIGLSPNTFTRCVRSDTEDGLITDYKHK
jgi:hypothetical protein